MVGTYFVMPDFGVQSVANDFAISIQGFFRPKRQASIQARIAAELDLCRKHQEI